MTNASPHTRPDPKVFQKTFGTVSIQLAASILTEVSDTILAGIKPGQLIDGKKVILVAYPDERESDLQNVVQQFQSKRLSVPLFAYNVNLNLIRDELRRLEGSGR